MRFPLSSSWLTPRTPHTPAAAHAWRPRRSAWLVAAVVAVYQWRILRRQAPAHEPVAPVEAEATAEAGTTGEAGATADVGATALVEIRAADAATLDRALSILRSAGVEVAIRTAPGTL